MKDKFGHAILVIILAIINLIKSLSKITIIVKNAISKYPFKLYRYIYQQ